MWRARAYAEAAGDDHDNRCGPEVLRGHGEQRQLEAGDQDAADHEDDGAEDDDQS